MGNKLLNSFKDSAISVAIQTHIAKKENIQGWGAVSLYLFNNNLSLTSVSSTMEEKMLCVFDFIVVTEIIFLLNRVYFKQLQFFLSLALSICSILLPVK